MRIIELIRGQLFSPAPSITGLGDAAEQRIAITRVDFDYSWNR